MSMRAANREMRKYESWQGSQKARSGSLEAVSDGGSSVASPRSETGWDPAGASNSRGLGGGLTEEEKMAAKAWQKRPVGVDDEEEEERPLSSLQKVVS